MITPGLMSCKISRLCLMILGFIATTSLAEDPLSFQVQVVPINKWPIATSPDGQFIALCDILNSNPLLEVYRIDHLGKPMWKQTYMNGTLMPIMFATADKMIVGPSKSLQVQETISGKVLHQFREPLYPLILTKKGVLAKELPDVPNHENSRLVMIDTDSYSILRLGKFNISAESTGKFCFDENRQRLYNAMMFGQVSEFDLTTRNARPLCRLVSGGYIYDFNSVDTIGDGAVMAVCPRGVLKFDVVHSEPVRMLSNTEKDESFDLSIPGMANKERCRELRFISASEFCLVTSERLIVFSWPECIHIAEYKLFDSIVGPVTYRVPERIRIVLAIPSKRTFLLNTTHDRLLKVEISTARHGGTDD